MQFVNDRVFHGSIQGLVAFPVVRLAINHDGTHGTREIIMRSTSIHPLPKAIRVAFGIGVDQNLLIVETMTGAQVRRPIHAISVMCAGPQSTNVTMPEMESLVDVWIQLNHLEWIAVIMRLEQQEIDSGCIF